MTTESQLKAIFAESPAGRAQFAGADLDSVQRHLAVEDAIAAAWTARGEKIDYATAVRLVAEKQEAAIHPPDVDPESAAIDAAAQVEIENAWRNRGEKLSYLDAVRRAAEKKAERR